MNNKGVTLIELLIVIVVLGIISAFAIPAVGTIISNTEKDSVLADAIAIENAADLYCAQTTCATDEELTWAQLSPYVQKFDSSLYTQTDGSATPAPDGLPTGVTDATTVAIRSSGEWLVYLDAIADGEYEWDAYENTTITKSPSALDRTKVTTD